MQVYLWPWVPPQRQRRQIFSGWQGLGHHVISCSCSWSIGLFCSLLVSCCSLTPHLLRTGSFISRVQLFWPQIWLSVFTVSPAGILSSIFTFRNVSLWCILLFVITFSVDCTSSCCVSLDSYFGGLSLLRAWGSGFDRYGLALGMKSAEEAAKHWTDFHMGPHAW